MLYFKNDKSYFLVYYTDFHTKILKDFGPKKRLNSNYIGISVNSLEETYNTDDEI